MRGAAQSLRGVATCVQAAAPSATLDSVFIVFAAAVLLVVPAVVLLVILQQRQVLGQEEH